MLKLSKQAVAEAATCDGLSEAMTSLERSYAKVSRCTSMYLFVPTPVIRFSRIENDQSLCDMGSNFANEHTLAQDIALHLGIFVANLETD